MNLRLSTLSSLLFRVAILPTLLFSGLLTNAKQINDLGQLPDWRKDRCRKGEIAVAKGTFVYAIAAEKAYERCEGCFEPIPFPQGSTWEPLGFSSQDDRKIGFYGRAWLYTSKNGQRQVVVAFRGTQFSEIADWTRGNFTTFRFLPWRTQYKAALEFTRQVLEKEQCVGVPVVFTGHSLGGGLAEYCQRFVEGSVAIVFHPSPNQGRIFSIGASEELQRKHVLRVFEKGEILRYVRWFLLVFNRVAEDATVDGQSARWLNFSQEGVIGDHAMMPFATNLIRLSALHFDEAARSVLDQISDVREASNSDAIYRWWNQDLVTGWTRGNETALATPIETESNQQSCSICGENDFKPRRALDRRWHVKL